MIWGLSSSLPCYKLGTIQFESQTAAVFQIHFPFGARDVSELQNRRIRHKMIYFHGGNTENTLPESRCRKWSLKSTQMLTWHGLVVSRRFKKLILSENRTKSVDFISLWTVVRLTDSFRTRLGTFLVYFSVSNPLELSSKF